MLKAIAFFLLAGFVFWVMIALLMFVCAFIPQLAVVWTGWGLLIRILVAFYISYQTLY